MVNLLSEFYGANSQPSVFTVRGNKLFQQAHCLPFRDLVGKITVIISSFCCSLTSPRPQGCCDHESLLRFPPGPAALAVLISLSPGLNEAY